MLPLYTISSKPDTIVQNCKLSAPFTYSPVYQARPGMKLPIIIQKENKTELVMAQWGTLKPFVSINRILSTRPYNILIRRQRCAAPANCFFSLKDDHPYLIRLIQYRMFLMGGMFHFANDQYYFTLLEADSPDMLRSFQGHIPISMAPEKLSSWLSGTDVGKVMHYADKAGSHWYDYFAVSRQITETFANNAELLKPLGISQQQLKEHENKLTALAFEKERPNRSNLKH